MKVCDKTCIFFFFPVINKYFLMAKRSLLSRCPSYIVPHNVLTKAQTVLRIADGCAFVRDLFSYQTFAWISLELHICNFNPWFQGCMTEKYNRRKFVTVNE